MKIQVTKDFYLSGEVQSAGTVLDVDKRLAVELVHMNRAAAYVEPEPAKPAKAKKEPTE